MGHLVTTSQSDVHIHIAQGAMIEIPNEIDLCIHLYHARILNMLLKLLGKLTCSCGCLVYSGYNRP